MRVVVVVVVAAEVVDLSVVDIANSGSSVISVVVVNFRVVDMGNSGSSDISVVVVNLRIVDIGNSGSSVISVTSIIFLGFRSSCRPKLGKRVEFKVWLARVAVVALAIVADVVISEMGVEKFSASVVDSTMEVVQLAKGVVELMNEVKLNMEGVDSPIQPIVDSFKATKAVVKLAAAVVALLSNSSPSMDVVDGEVKLVEVKFGDVKLVEVKLIEVKFGDVKLVEAKSGDVKLVQVRLAEVKLLKVKLVEVALSVKLAVVALMGKAVVEIAASARRVVVLTLVGMADVEPVSIVVAALSNSRPNNFVVDAVVRLALVGLAVKLAVVVSAVKLAIVAFTAKPVVALMGKAEAAVVEPTIIVEEAPSFSRPSRPIVDGEVKLAIVVLGARVVVAFAASVEIDTVGSAVHAVVRFTFATIVDAVSVIRASGLVVVDSVIERVGRGANVGSVRRVALASSVVDALAKGELGVVVFHASTNIVVVPSASCAPSFTPSFAAGKVGKNGEWLIRVMFIGVGDKVALAGERLMWVMFIGVGDKLALDGAGERVAVSFVMATHCQP